MEDKTYDPAVLEKLGMTAEEFKSFIRKEAKRPLSYHLKKTKEIILDDRFSGSSYELRKRLVNQLMLMCIFGNIPKSKLKELHLEEEYNTRCEAF